MDETAGVTPASPPTDRASSPAAPPTPAPSSAAPAPPASAPPAPAPTGDELPAGAPRTRRVSRFDKLWEPVRRLWSGDPGDSVAPAGTVTRVKHRQPRVLFVDTGNASRSQMAECFARAAGLHAESAGTFPVGSIPHEVVDTMAERGFDLTGVRPKILDPVRLGAFDRVVLFEVSLPPALREGARIEEWNDLWDPAGLPLQGYKMVASEIEKRVNRLAKVLHGKQAAAAQGKKPKALA